MAIAFPVSLDTLPKPTNATQRNAPGFELGTVVGDLATAIERLQTKVGKDTSLVTSSHDWMLRRFTFSGANVGIGTVPTAQLDVQVDAVDGTRRVWVTATQGILHTGSNNSGALYLGTNTIADPTAGIEVSWGDAATPQIHMGVTRGGNRAAISAYYSQRVELSSAGVVRVLANNTGVSAWFNTVGALRSLEVGAVDSGGAGFRNVRVAN